MFIFFIVSLYSQNFVSNAGIEYWIEDPPGNWTPEDWTAQLGLILFPETENIHSGTKSCKITLTTQTSSLSDLDNTAFPVTTGIPFEIKAWVYDNDPAVRVTLALVWDYVNPTYTQVFSVDQDSWQELSYTGFVPEIAENCQVRFRLYDVPGEWDGDGIAYIDDVSYENAQLKINTAFSISSTEVDIHYNGYPPSADPPSYLLTGSNNTTFSTATIDEGSPNVVHLGGASPEMVGDIILDAIDDSDDEGPECPFYAGIMPVANTKSTNPAGHIDSEHYATFQGIVTAHDGVNNCWIHDATGPNNGIWIWDYKFGIETAQGDNVIFVGQRGEINGSTYLTIPVIGIQLIWVLSSGNVIESTLISGGDIPAEADTNGVYDGQFCRINSLYASQLNEEEHSVTCVDCYDQSEVKVSDNTDDSFHFGNIVYELHDYYNIFGVVNYDNGYKFIPRQQTDLVNLGPTPLPPGQMAMEIIQDGEGILCWHAMPGATSYNVYCFGDGIELQLLTSTTETSVPVQAEVSANNCFFYVTAVVEDGQ